MVKRKIFTEVQKRIIACRQDYMCVGDGCNKLQLLPCTWELDHIKPLFQQGSNNHENLQIICPNCHALKTQTELMDAAETRRDTKQKQTKHRRYWMKTNIRNRKTDTISPYFNHNDPRFLGAVGSRSSSVHTNIGLSLLSRHRYQPG